MNRAYRRHNVDREGWSAKLFQEIILQGFHVLTYRKGKQESWPAECFGKVEAKIDGQTVHYLLAEQKVKTKQLDVLLAKLSKAATLVPQTRNATSS